jgi:hypothetical protein
MSDKRNAYRVWREKPEGQEKLRRPRKRRKDNIERVVYIRKGGRELDSYGSE